MDGDCSPRSVCGIGANMAAAMEVCGKAGLANAIPELVGSLHSPFLDPSPSCFVRPFKGKSGLSAHVAGQARAVATRDPVRTGAVSGGSGSSNGAANGAVYGGVNGSVSKGRSMVSRLVMWEDMF